MLRAKTGNEGVEGIRRFGRARQMCYLGRIFGAQGKFESKVGLLFENYCYPAKSSVFVFFSRDDVAIVNRIVGTLMPRSSMPSAMIIYQAPTILEV